MEDASGAAFIFGKRRLHSLATFEGVQIGPQMQPRIEMQHLCASLGQIYSVFHCCTLCCSIRIVCSLVGQRNSVWNLFGIPLCVWNTFYFPQANVFLESCLTITFPVVSSSSLTTLLKLCHSRVRFTLLVEMYLLKLPD